MLHILQIFHLAHQVGDIVDAKDCDMGAWFEAKIVGMSMDNSAKEATVLYHIIFDGYVATYLRTRSIKVTAQKSKYRPTQWQK